MPPTRPGSRPRRRPPPPPWLDDAAEIVNALRRIVRAIELYSQEVRKAFGLTGPQLWALKTLHRHGALPMTDLAIALAVQPSTLSVLIDRLERRGLVRRVRQRGDRRVVDLRLTAGGIRLAARAPSAAQGRLLHGLRDLPPARLRTMRRVLSDLVDIMEAGDVEAQFFFAKE
jgi:DNA-binding MarR family transcriptional regulator